MADQGEAGQVAAAQGIPRHQLFDDEDQADFYMLKAGSSCSSASTMHLHLPSV